MKNKVLWLISAVPLLITAIVLPYFPDRIPMHYDIAGNIDRWGSKNEQFIFPVTILFLTLFWQIFISYYTKKQANAKEEKEQQEARGNTLVIYIAAYGMTVLFSGMHYCFLYSAWIEAAGESTGMAIDVNRVIFAMAGIFLVIVGNYMPKARKNSLIGLRTGWSMENDQTWAASQRAGGKILVLSGILMLIGSLFLRDTALTVVCLGLIAAAAVIATVCSYKAYLKYK